MSGIDDTQFRRPGLRAILYARNSHDRTRRGISVNDQFAEMRPVAAREMWPIVGEFRDVGMSATRHARKPRDEFAAMMEAVRSGAGDVLMTWESARAQRDLAVYVALRDLCHDTKTLWWYTGELYDLTLRSHRNRTALDAVRDEDAGEGIREGVLRTVRQRAERGEPHGRIPFGYRRIYHSDTGKLIAQIPDDALPTAEFAFEALANPKAPIVREIVRRIAARQSAYSIAQDLNRRGIPTPFRNARGWDIIQVVRTASNPAYIGMRVHQGKVIGKATWEPLLKDDDVTAWWQASAIIADPTRKTHRDNAVKHLLSGLAFCGAPGCGEYLRMRHPRNAFCYTCIAAFHVAMAEHLLDDYVEAAVLERLERPDAADAFLNASNDDDVVQAALAEISEKQAKLEEARALATKGTLSLTSLAAMEAAWMPEIEAARERARRSSIPPVLEQLVGPNAREVWGGLTIPERRQALRAIVTVTVNPTGKGARSIRPGRVTLDWLTPGAPRRRPGPLSGPGANA
ncbi:recombinase family protein [Embleya scabrispora]|nr:recombinase family protein [Embleya scabrispora]